MALYLIVMRIDIVKIVVYFGNKNDIYYNRILTIVKIDDFIKILFLILILEIFFI